MVPMFVCFLNSDTRVAEGVKVFMKLFVKCKKYDPNVSPTSFYMPTESVMSVFVCKKKSVQDDVFIFKGILL